MTPETIVTQAAPYIIESIKNSKTGQKASNELLSAFWQWIRPLFLKDEPDMVKKLESAPDNTKYQGVLEHNLEKMITNDNKFKEELLKKLSEISQSNSSSMEQSNIHNEATNIGNNNKVIQGFQSDGDINITM